MATDEHPEPTMGTAPYVFATGDPGPASLPALIHPCGLSLVDRSAVQGRHSMEPATDDFIIVHTATGLPPTAQTTCCCYETGRRLLDAMAAHWPETFLGSRKEIKQILDPAEVCEFVIDTLQRIKRGPFGEADQEGESDDG